MQPHCGYMVGMERDPYGRKYLGVLCTLSAVGSFEG
jgi:hypothetical protein